MPNRSLNLSHSDALFQRRMNALYQSDAEGRIVCTNEWEHCPPPYFHLMRTADGVICRFQAGLPDEIAHLLEALSRLEPPERFAEKLPLHYERYLEVLREYSPIHTVWSGPAFVALEDIVPLNETTLINEDNALLLRQYMGDWLPDVPYRHPFVAVVKDGGAVSICASVRITKSVHCAGVETHPHYRHCGYASDVVARWANAVRDEGAMPFYSTSWNNVASQRVAQKLKMTLVGLDFHVR